MASEYLSMYDPNKHNWMVTDNANFLIYDFCKYIPNLAVEFLFSAKENKQRCGGGEL